MSTRTPDAAHSAALCRSELPESASAFSGRAHTSAALRNRTSPSSPFGRARPRPTTRVRTVGTRSTDDPVLAMGMSIHLLAGLKTSGFEVVGPLRVSETDAAAFAQEPRTLLDIDDRRML